MSTPKISVIVPVYKVEQYLHRCIDSILAQTFTDFELLLINDGSPDNCGSICDEYAAKDTRVRVFHKENGGVSSARNLGLDNAKGEWVAFVDSDDWVEDLYLAQVQIDYNPNNIDVIYFGIVQDWDKFQKIRKQEKKGYISKECFFKLRHRLSCSFAYFYRRSLIEKYNIRFNCNIKYSEDREFIAKTTIVASSFYLLETAKYHYVYNPCSAVNSKRLFQNCFDDLAVIQSVNEFVNKYLNEINNIDLSNLYILLLNSFIDAVSLERRNSKEYKHTSNAFKIILPIINTRKLSLKSMLKFWIFTLSPSLLFHLKNNKKRILRKLNN